MSITGGTISAVSQSGGPTKESHLRRLRDRLDVANTDLLTQCCRLELIADRLLGQEPATIGECAEDPDATCEIEAHTQSVLRFEDLASRLSRVVDRLGAL